MSGFLLVADAEENLLSLVKAESLTQVERFETTGRIAVLGASANRRYGFAVHRDDHCVSIITAEGRSVRVVPTGKQPTHFHAHNDLVVIFNDGSGSVSIFDGHDVYTPLTVPATQQDHGSAVVIDGYLLAGHLRAGAVDIYKQGDVELLQRFDNCPVLHGAAQVGSSALFGCSDGVMIIEHKGDTFAGVKLENPPDTPPRTRVGLFATHPKSTWALGNFGSGLALIDPQAHTMSVLPLPGQPIQFAFDSSGDGALALTTDGVLHRLSLPEGKITASVQVTSAVEPPKGPDGKPRPGMTVSDGVAYIVSPDEQLLFEVTLDPLSVTRKVALQGKPRSIIYLQ